MTLQTLSANALCAFHFAIVGGAFIFALSLIRRLGDLAFLGVFATGAILVAGIVGMVGAGVTSSGTAAISATHTSDFYNAFLAVTNPFVVP